MNPRAAVAARGLVAALALVGGFEGLRTVAYLDPVGIPTICFGEIENVRMGQKASIAECEDKLATRILEYDDAVVGCLGETPQRGPRVAFVSFAYNVGTGAFCGSTLARKYKAGDLEGACAELDRWVYAKGVKWPGLVKRRAQERRICESALT
jgi:lysozyme